jgi:hypothetical protein
MEVLAAVVDRCVARQLVESIPIQWVAGRDGRIPVGATLGPGKEHQRQR